MASSASNSRRPASVAAVVVFLVIGALATMVDAKSWEYGVMMDAGSTGTRCYVYHWPRRHDNSVPLVQQMFDQVHQKEASLKVSPGLADFASNISGIDAYLGPLIDFAKKYVPADQVASTPIYLFGTAGMRLLHEEDQDAILSRTASVFSNSGFSLDTTDVAVITGSTEALFGWIAVNYLTSALGTEHSYGSLDLGGASTQIAFATHVTDTDSTASLEQGASFPGVVTVSFANVRYSVYVVSYLNYGANAFRAQVNEALISKAADNATTIDDPCLNTGLTVPYVSEEGFHVNMTGTGSASSQECKGLSQALLGLISKENCDISACRGVDGCRCAIEGHPQPVISSGADFYAMSAYYWTASFLQQTTGSPADIDKATEQFCTLTWDQVLNKYPSFNHDLLKTYCGLGNQVTSLLVPGYGFGSNSTQVRYNGTIAGKEVSWALGAMLMKANLLPISVNGGQSQALTSTRAALIGTGAVLGALLLVAGAVVLYRRTRRSGRKEYEPLVNRTMLDA